MTDHSSRRTVEERREQLIDAAISVLAEEGIDAATTRRITDRAGVALGAFHYAFASKDALLRAVIERFADGIEQVVADAAAGPIDDLPGFARRVIEGYWTFVERTTDLQLAQYELTVHALRDPALRDLAKLQYERVATAVTRVLERAPEIPAGQPRDDLARYLAATMDGLILQHIIERDEDASRRRLELYLRSMPGLLDAIAGDS